MADSNRAANAWQSVLRVEAPLGLQASRRAYMPRVANRGVASPNYGTHDAMCTRRHDMLSCGVPQTTRDHHMGAHS